MKLLNKIFGRAEATAVSEPVAHLADAPARPQRQLPPARAPLETVEVRQARRNHSDLIWTTERLGERLVVELDAIQTLLSAILEKLRARPA
jgi:hypothetical protein